ncbi:MAG: replicative DNA helicase [Chitinivibrionales bacterium]|nr:replicative DNA helicase [Chitinivibrionales bacterium]MBD3396783.1 replicative DNA helicase [Chitinivibrionales bacterium]
MALARTENRTTTGKVPPQALDVERTVLGSMLIDSNACDTAMETLTEECFYSTAHRRIFACIEGMIKNTVPVDIVTLAEELKKKDWLESVGSEAYLSELVENVATSANIAYHAKILESKATLRQLISAAAEISTQCFDADADAHTVIDQAEARIFRISEERASGGFESIRTLVPRTFEDIERYSKEGGYHGVLSGFTKLDEMTGGLHKGELVIVAGRPGMGKTAFALSLAAHAAAHEAEKTTTAVFSLEMSKEQLVQRMLCAAAKVDMHRLRTGRLKPQEKTQLGIHANPLYEAPIFIDDTPGLNVMEIRAKSRRLKARENLGLVIIDYLQLMSSVDRAENRQQEISSISRGLKAIAKELSVPVVALSQLSRAVEQRGGDHRPQLSDLRESGAIEQDADVVMFVFREYNYQRDNESLKYLAEIIVGKQRNGPTGAVKLSFMPEYTQFDNLDEIHFEEPAEF